MNFTKYLQEATGIKPGKLNYVPRVDYTDPLVALTDTYADVFLIQFQKKWGLDEPRKKFKNVVKFFDGKTSTDLDGYYVDGTAFPMMKSFKVEIDFEVEDYTTWDNFIKEEGKAVKAANDLLKEFKKLAKSEKLKPKKIEIELIDKKIDKEIQKERKSTQSAQLYKELSDYPRHEEFTASINVEW